MNTKHRDYNPRDYRDAFLGGLAASPVLFGAINRSEINKHKGTIKELQEQYNNLVPNIGNLKNIVSREHARSEALARAQFPKGKLYDFSEFAKRVALENTHNQELKKAQKELSHALATARELRRKQKDHIRNIRSKSGVRGFIPNSPAKWLLVGALGTGAVLEHAAGAGAIRSQYDRIQARAKTASATLNNKHIDHNDIITYLLESRGVDLEKIAGRRVSRRFSRFMTRKEQRLNRNLKHPIAIKSPEANAAGTPPVTIIRNPEDPSNFPFYKNKDIQRAALVGTLGLAGGYGANELLSYINDK